MFCDRFYLAAQPSSPLRVETEREKEVGQQPKQMSDVTAKLQDELSQAKGREAQLQRQLDKMTLGMIYNNANQCM